MVSLDFLEKIDIFKGLDDNQLAAVQGCCQETEFQRGDRIFGVREDPICLWAVMEGKIDLEQDSPGSMPFHENIVSSVSEAMIFGWPSLVSPYKYRLSAYCATRKCKVIKIDKGCLTKLFDGDKRMGYKVMSRLLSVISNRFHQLQEEVIKSKGQELMNRW